MPRFPVDTSDWKVIGSDRVSAIGLGTWAIRSPQRAIETLVEAIESGLVNLIDTAEMYGEGAAERIVGEVVRRVGRDRVFITTKMLPSRLSSEERIEAAARASLERLGVREVDLFLIHWPAPGMPIAEQVRRFEKIVYGKGYARYIGVSNFDARELLEAVHATSMTEIVVDQVHYSVLHRAEAEEILETILRENLNITIQAYTPLERGAVARNKVVREIAEKYGKTPVQVALNFLIARPRVVAIPKTEQKQHLREILGALGWRLSPEDIERLEQL
ncbi:aldo/keto reductase [Pyrofollis japonicus]|uniref:aldo/keto reductase n=1 Tax=Pyrofollis japonicus TaxID=3060460 RepID=UPI00295AFCDA|nr:aldo/keto reductase [Pyrofollis japonicus]BEP17917.1 aldo/keto reductase [Pyrofollis japonicus]